MEKELRLLEALIEEEKKGNGIDIKNISKYLDMSNKNDMDRNKGWPHEENDHSNNNTNNNNTSFIHDPKNRSWLFIVVFLVMFTLRVMHLFLSRRDGGVSGSGKGLGFTHISSQDFIQHNIAQQVLLEEEGGGGGGDDDNLGEENYEL